MRCLFRFAHLPIRYKLLLSYSLVFILTITVASATIYSIVRKTIESNIESELNNSTDAMLNMVRTAAAVSIKNHLRAVAEKNLELAQAFYRKQEVEGLSEEAAKDLARDVLLNQTIGKTGYIYCLDSDGVVVIHPSEALLGVDVSSHQFVRSMKEMKEGYLEYDWKNPGEETARPKALYMTYFEPWDWIISVSTYRGEFNELVNVSDFRESVLALKFGDTGYAYINDRSGNVIIHPRMEGENLYHENWGSVEFFNEMLDRKNGKITYSWQNPGEEELREKLVIFHYLPEFKWVVASSSYLDEFYAPLRTLRTIVITTVLVSLLLVLPLTFRISATITDPLKSLEEHLSVGATGDFSVRVENAGHDEIGQVARYFNHFMERLEDSAATIQEESRERRRLERELLEVGDRERRKIGQELHDDLGPHLCGIEVLSKLLSTELQERDGEAAQEAENIWGLTGDAIEKTRRLARGLFPVHLENTGFEYALSELAQTTEAIFGVRCKVEGTADLSRSGVEASTQLYYIAREALHNAVKHAEAHTICLQLAQDGQRVVLTVSDDGRGMPAPGAATSDGMGLRLMGFRAATIGAEFQVSSDPGQGTTVTVSANIPAAPAT